LTPRSNPFAAGKAAEEEEVVVPPKKSLVCPCLGF
jgi:hypothetical protein